MPRGAGASRPLVVSCQHGSVAKALSRDRVPLLLVETSRLLEGGGPLVEVAARTKRSREIDVDIRSKPEQVCPAKEPHGLRGELDCRIDRPLGSEYRRLDRTPGRLNGTRLRRRAFARHVHE